MKDKKFSPVFTCILLCCRLHFVNNDVMCMMYYYRGLKMFALVSIFILSKIAPYARGHVLWKDTSVCPCDSEAVDEADVIHDDVIKWKHFPRNRPFVRGIHRSPVNSPHKGQWRRALMFSLICVWINAWVNNREAGDLRRYRAHYDVIVMSSYGSGISE